jgi:tungstate transport system substrate-binding protein
MKKTAKSLFTLFAAAIILMSSVQVSLLSAFAANPPAVPQNVTAVSASYNSIKISWSPVDSASGYVVYRYSSLFKQFIRLAVTKSTSFTNTLLMTGNTYSYKARAYTTVTGSNLYGTPSAAVSAQPVPSAPVNLKAVLLTPTSTKLTWSSVSGANGYVVYRFNSTSKAFDNIKTVTSASFTNTGLTSGKTYFYVIKAYQWIISGKTIYSSPSAAVSAPFTHSDNVIRCSTTTSVNDSGLMSVLEPLFEKATGYDLQITSNGSGAAIALGRTGNADVLLVHSPADEAKFVSDGYGIARISFMYNFFVIAGPAEDPAGVKSASSAVTAFQDIASTRSTFISRGDASGTNKAELNIWKAAGLNPNPSTNSWYISAGQGMGACLTMADQMSAYLLTDTATYLSMKSGFGDLKILIDRDDYMKNTYSLIACNPAKNTGLNFSGANDFIDWMTLPSTLAVIADYGKAQYGQQLFFLL